MSGSSGDPDAGPEMLKVVTILFADVVGSTARSEKMHPEDTRALMTDFFQAMTEEITSEGGIVERIVGDGLMADFGIPFAHEDDPLRAVRAARAMLSRLERWNIDKDDMRRIEIRIGINTGEISAAGIPGQDLLVTGDAVNVAARLEQAAKTGSIVIGERTARSVRRAFELRALEPVIAKGKSHPVSAFEVLRTARESSSLHELAAPLIGRQEELTELLEIFERCRRTESPYLVTLLGDAGMGKSRLTQEFLEKLPRDSHILAGNCIAYGEGADVRPLREILGRAAGFGSSESPPAVLAAIEGLVGGLGSEKFPRNAVAALASTVGVEPRSFREIDPRIRHREFLAAWRALLEAMATDHPVVIVIQDVHWAGELLLDTISDLACRTEGPILFMCPARPDLLDSRPDWGVGVSNHVTLGLKPLSEEASAELISSFVAQDDPLGEQRKSILDRCEGNPFFVQEVVRHLMESGHLETSGARDESSLAQVEIPDTVHGVLLARIDLMDDDVKRVGQQAAVVGRTFWESAVAELCETNDLHRLLGALERKAFITEDLDTSVTGEIGYFFNHILIRDALYQTMPRRLRGTSHDIVARWIQEKAGERLDEHLQTIAYHYEQAYELLGRDDLRIKARHHLLQASADALQRFAVARAASLAKRAVDLSVGPAERVEALELAGDQAMTSYRIDDAWSAYCDALLDAPLIEGDDKAVARIASKAALAATRYEGAMNVNPPAEDIRQKVALGLSALKDTGEAMSARCLLLCSEAYAALDDDPEKQERAAVEALSLAEGLKDPALVSMALDASAFAISWRSDFGEMWSLQERRIKLVPSIKDVNEVCDIYGSASWSSFLVGRHADAITYATECLKRAEGVAPGDYQHALQWRVMANFRAGRWDAALEDQAELEALVLDGDGLIPVVTGGAFSTALLCNELRGDHEAADRYLELVTRLRTQQEVAGQGSGGPRPLTALALLHNGRTEDAHDWLDYGGGGFITGLLLEARGEVARIQEDRETMRSLIAEVADRSEMGSATLICYRDRLAARLSQLDGADEQVETLLVSSAEGFAGCEFPWEEAMSRLLLAEHRLNLGHPADAQPELRRALGIFEQLGSVQEVARTAQALELC